MYWLLVLVEISYQYSNKYCQYQYQYLLRKSIAILRQYWKSIGNIVNTNTILQFTTMTPASLPLCYCVWVIFGSVYRQRQSA